jgi:hypothetical protein
LNTIFSESRRLLFKSCWGPIDRESAAKSAVRDAYKIGRKSKELIADVQEQIQDIMAEVDAESARA